VLVLARSVSLFKNGEVFSLKRKSCRTLGTLDALRHSPIFNLEFEPASPRSRQLCSDNDIAFTQSPSTLSVRSSKNFVSSSSSVLQSPTARMTKRTKSPSNPRRMPTIMLTDNPQRSASPASSELDTVPHFESKSRRWKSPSMPDTFAHSAERTQLRDKLWVSGSAKAARRLWQEAPGQCRKFKRRHFAHHHDSSDMRFRTPAAAATRSTIRRLREIAEV
jgi:hypothetical protein